MAKPGARPWGYPIALENIRIDYGVPCRVRAKSDTIEGTFAIVQCLSGSESLQAYFLRAMGLVLETLPDSAPPVAIAEQLDDLVELFRAATRPSSGSVMGLGGELFVTVNSRNPLAMIRAWHIEAEDHFDFTDGDQRLEIKCSGDGTRRHYFSLEQVYPPSGATVLVASLMVERIQGGLSLGELWDGASACAALDPELRMKLERICLATLGDAWEKARAQEYDPHLARSSLAYYDVSSIPRVPDELTSGVSEVRFRSDLSLASPVEVGPYTAQGRLFEACLG